MINPFGSLANQKFVTLNKISRKPYIIQHCLFALYHFQLEVLNAIKVVIFVCCCSLLNVIDKTIK